MVCGFQLYLYTQYYENSDNTDILYNSKIIYNVGSICTNITVKLEFFKTEIQFV